MGEQLILRVVLVVRVVVLVDQLAIRLEVLVVLEILHQLLHRKEIQVERVPVLVVDKQMEVAAVEPVQLAGLVLLLVVALELLELLLASQVAQ
jgi:hypothetical protein